MRAPRPPSDSHTHTRTHNCDQAVLSHLASVFKLQGVPEEATVCYENAAKQAPEYVCLCGCVDVCMCVCVSVCARAHCGGGWGGIKRGAVCLCARASRLGFGLGLSWCETRIVFATSSSTRAHACVRTCVRTCVRASM